MSAPTALDRPALVRLWAAIAERLQRNGLRPSGVLRLDGLDRAERHAIAGLLGRPVSTDRVSVDLADLDRRLRDSGVITGLVGAAEAVQGPLVDRPRRRAAHAEAKARVWAVGRDTLSDVGLAAATWVEPWLDDTRRAGSLGRIPSDRAEHVLATAVRCVAALPPIGGVAPCGRGELASLVTGDAHALDDGTLLGSLVLRAAARIAGTTYPTTAVGRRTLWREVGVMTDEVSTTVLTMGLRSAGNTWIDDRTDAGWESHLTARDLHRVELRPPPTGVVHVCENPRVLEAAVDAGARAVIICTMGQPTVVVTTLLDRLAAAGADLRYHGDFDWPGIAIANGLIGTRGCVPWRFRAEDYVEALGRLAGAVIELPRLEDAIVQARWDPDLTVEMTAARRAVHEELVLRELLSDLSEWESPIRRTSALLDSHRGSRWSDTPGGRRAPIGR